MNNKKALIHLLLILVIVAIVIFIVLESGVVKYVSDSGEVSLRAEGIRDFKGIDIAVPSEVHLTSGADYSVVIEADKEIMKHIKVRKQGDVLEIYKSKFVFFENKDVKVYISMPVVEEVIVSSSGKVIGDNLISSENLNLQISGTGKIDLNVDVNDLNTFISGTGDVEIEGEAENSHIKISGSGDVDALNLDSERVFIVISGVGDVDVSASELLDITISGTGFINYQGDAEIKKQISGFGSINSL